jgi:ribonuclease VapC
VRPGLVVDSSALLAVLFEEAERARALDAIFDSERRLISSLSFLETSIVTTARKGLAGKTLLDGLLKDSAIEVVELDREQAEIARDAWYELGKGRHTAGLNLGDTCSYALATARGFPLLFKGDDFSRTDLEGIELSA